MHHDTTLSGQVYGYDPDGDAISAVLETGPSHGTLDFNSDGTFICTPANGYTGIDQFSYRFLDAQAESNVATVTIEILDNPLTNIDNITLWEGDPVNISFASSLDGQYVITYRAYGLPEGVSLDSQTGIATGRVSYNVVPDGVDETVLNATLEATVNGLTFTRDFQITVLARSELEPVAIADYYSFAGEGLVVSAESGLLSNDLAHPQQLPLAVGSFTPLNGGNWTVSADGSFQFTEPEQDQEEVYLAQYTVTTPSGFQSSTGVFVQKVDPFMQVQGAYKDVVDKFSNTVPSAIIKANVTGLVHHLLNREAQVRAGRAIIRPKSPEDTLKQLGVPQDLQQRAKEQFAKDNRIPVGDVEMLISMRFILNPEAKQAEVQLYVLLRDKQRRVQPKLLGHMNMQVHLERLEGQPHQYQGFKDFGGDYSWE